MATAISNISELPAKVNTEKIEILSYSDKLSTVNKVKANLGILYFLCVSVVMTTLLL